ncbi:MAG: alanine--tRNA ligase-related protein, partial [Nanoarchaeota archaeon]
GIVPSNTERDYVLRRFIRRVIRFGRELVINSFTPKIAEPVFKIYDDYKNIQKNKKLILDELEKEETKFNETIEKGMNKFKKLIKDKKKISGEDSFLLYQSYGFPFEMTRELAQEKKINIFEKEFQEELEKHQELSRTASAGKFKSGLADNSEKTTKLHTATHILLAALRTILKDDNIIQKGSNITSERIRFDFSFPRKLTDKEIKDTEELVNAQIQKSCEVIREEMSPEEAKKKGALGVFDGKYGEKVSVYTIGDFSKEICAGPHVSNLCEIGRLKIIKEESSSAGVRRIKAVLE